MSSPYLPAEGAGGCPYCLDPDSPELRDALTRPAPSDDSRIPAADLAEDLGFYHELLGRLCPWYADLLRIPGFDAGNFFDDWRHRILAQGAIITFRKGVVEPLIELQQLLPNRHLSFRGADDALDTDRRLAYHEYWNVLSDPAGFDTGTCDTESIPDARASTLRVAPVLRSDGELAHALVLSATGGYEAVRVRCGGRVVQLRKRPSGTRASPAGAYDWKVVGDTAVVTLRCFQSGPSSVAGRLERFVGDYEEHRQCPKVLFDLRGNPGGDLRFVRRWISQARADRWQSYPILDWSGALWPCSDWNRVVEWQIRDGRVDEPEARAERVELRAGWFDDPLLRTPQLDPGWREAGGSRPYSGRVFVVVDRRTGSSGELAAVELERALGALVLGERTAGAMQYGEARRFVLPRTGLVCQVPIRRFFFDGEVEGVGWPARLYLERTDQPAEELAPWLESAWHAAIT